LCSESGFDIWGEVVSSCKQAHQRESLSGFSTTPPRTKCGTILTLGGSKLQNISCECPTVVWHLLNTTSWLSSPRQAVTHLIRPLDKWKLFVRFVLLDILQVSPLTNRGYIRPRLHLLESRGFSYLLLLGELLYAFITRQVTSTLFSVPS
jgi:hypothetical protein